VLRQIVCAPKIARFPAATAVPSTLSLHPRASRFSPRAAYMHVVRMEEPGRSHDASLARIRQPDHTGGAALPRLRAQATRGLGLSLSAFLHSFN
jgi:hypothetical protein